MLVGALLGAAVFGVINIAFDVYTETQKPHNPMGLLVFVCIGALLGHLAA